MQNGYYQTTSHDPVTKAILITCVILLIIAVLTPSGQAYINSMVYGYPGYNYNYSYPYNNYSGYYQPASAYTGYNYNYSSYREPYTSSSYRYYGTSSNNNYVPLMIRPD